MNQLEQREGVFLGALESARTATTQIADPRFMLEREKGLKLDRAALYGLPGRIVEVIAPHTETDQVGLLVHSLAEYSCVIGTKPYVRLDGGRSPLLLWAVLVGETSKARKGTADRRIKPLFEKAFPSWIRGEYRGTLSSGEGLAFAVRDPVYQRKEIRRSGNRTGEFEDELIDEGVKDKRLFLVQSEFGSTLKIMQREGNSLSGVLRDSWDAEDLRPLTKRERITSTQPHIAIVGHVTQEELLRYLGETDMANGFGNRFAWFTVRRAQVLPFPTEPSSHEINSLATNLREAGEFAQSVEELNLTSEAREAWIAIYAELSAGKPGLAGALLGRAEAQVRRLAALYALMDKQSVVDVPHLEAAIALWDYSEASVSLIFGNRLGDFVADAIYDAIRNSESGLTDSDLNNLFGRHQNSRRLSNAKVILQAKGRIQQIKEETGGRPRVVWRVAKKAN